MVIHSSVFLASYSHIKQCPNNGWPEFAFIGRSNVGKSSLINMLVNRKGLAKTSQTPGKTRLLNFFEIDHRWYLVDLPGFGYARTSKTNREGFAKLITDYITKRETLLNLFMLVDARHEPLANDLAFIHWLGGQGVPFSIVFTKTDKLTPAQLEKTLSAYKVKLLESWEELPAIFVTSAENKLGREELLQYVEKWI